VFVNIDFTDTIRSMSTSSYTYRDDYFSILDTCRFVTATRLLLARSVNTTRFFREEYFSDIVIIKAACAKNNSVARYLSP